MPKIYGAAAYGPQRRMRYDMAPDLGRDTVFPPELAFSTMRMLNTHADAISRPSVGKHRLYASGARRHRGAVQAESGAFTLDKSNIPDILAKISG